MEISRVKLCTNVYYTELVTTVTNWTLSKKVISCWALFYYFMWVCRIAVQWYAELLLVALTIVQFQEIYDIFHALVRPLDMEYAYSFF